MFPLFATVQNDSEVIRDAFHALAGDGVAVWLETLEKGVIVRFIQFPPVGGELERNERMERFYSNLEFCRKINFYKKPMGWGYGKAEEGDDWVFDVRLLQAYDLPDDFESEEEEEEENNVPEVKDPDPEPVPETKKPKKRFIQRIAEMFS